MIAEGTGGTTFIEQPTDDNEFGLFDCLDPALACSTLHFRSATTSPQPPNL